MTTSTRPPIGADVSWPETNHGVTFTRRARVHAYERRVDGLVAVLETAPGGPLMEIPPDQLTVEGPSR